MTTTRYAPAFVMKVEATGEVFGVECFLEGAYVKWNSNGLFPETFMRGADDAPTAFCHFTYVVIRLRCMFECSLSGIHCQVR